MNTNDFSKCKVGEVLWDHARGSECTVERNNEDEPHILVGSNGTGWWFSKIQQPERQLLFFSKPQIIAPPEPIRLPDYKEGEWIVVWEHDYSRPDLVHFHSFLDGKLYGILPTWRISASYANHCSLADLPEVLAKWGEK